MCLMMPTTSISMTNSAGMPTTEEATVTEAAGTAETRIIDKKQLQPPPATVDDAENDNDQVKVYSKEEDEDENQETKPYEGHSSRDLLSDDKSTLINESEQSKDARHHDLAFASKPTSEIF